MKIYSRIYKMLVDDCAVQKVGSHLTVHFITPQRGNQGWQVELLEFSRPIPKHSHAQQRQVVLVAEGELSVSIEDREGVTLKSGELIVVDPGVNHALCPKNEVRLIQIGIPGIFFQDDPQKEVIDKRPLAELDVKDFGEKLDFGDYSVYELVTGESAENKWSVALIEIQDSPKHFHRIEKETFIVAEGVLEVQVDGRRQLLSVGGTITILPEQVHHLKSAQETPVRVLCMSFPAFDPEDMYLVD